jgi:hypothetical protein
MPDLSSPQQWLESNAFWVVMPFSKAEIYSRFGRNVMRLYQGWKLS